MITPMQMYWITRCDSFVNAAIPFIILTCVIMAFGLIAYIISEVEGNKKEFNAILKILPYDVFIFFLSLMISIFVPSTKEMAAIIVVPAIVNNEKIQESAKNLVDLANEWMVELKPNKVKTDEK